MESGDADLLFDDEGLCRKLIKPIQTGSRFKKKVNPAKTALKAKVGQCIKMAKKWK